MAHCFITIRSEFIAKRVYTYKELALVYGGANINNIREYVVREGKQIIKRKYL